jgi:RHS repeat-associated protein
LTDSAGSQVAHYIYTAFGDAIVSLGIGDAAAANPFRFSTKYVCPVNELVYYGYRWYDPANGRWLNRDPIGENGGINLYAFVENNGVNKWDYLGLKKSDPNKNLTKIKLTYTWECINADGEAVGIEGQGTVYLDDEGNIVDVEDEHKNFDSDLEGELGDVRLKASITTIDGDTTTTTLEGSAGMNEDGTTYFKGNGEVVTPDGEGHNVVFP